jgi:hypothetical protein
MLETITIPEYASAARLILERAGFKDLGAQSGALDPSFYQPAMVRKAKDTQK